MCQYIKDCLYLKTDQNFGILLKLLYQDDCSKICYFHVQVLCVGYSFGYSLTICLQKETVFKDIIILKGGKLREAVAKKPFRAAWHFDNRSMIPLQQHCKIAVSQTEVYGTK